MEKSKMCVKDLYQLQLLSKFHGLHPKYIPRSLRNERYTFSVNTALHKSVHHINNEYVSIVEDGIFDIDTVLGLGLFPYLKKRLVNKSIVMKRQSAFVEYSINRHESIKEKTSEVLLDVMNITDRYIMINRDGL